MSRVADWTIDGADGQPILGHTHRPPDGVTPTGVLVCCHGFKGYKDYGFFPRLAGHAADAGLIALRLNLSHSGMTHDIQTFARPDLFEKDTWGKQVHDIGRVVDEIAAPHGLPVVLFGHSRGGLASLLAADRLQTKIAGVVAAAAPADACSLDESQRALLRKAGRLVSPSGRTGQDLYVGGGWLAEIEADPERFDPVRALSRLAVPALILHGDGDATVPVSALQRYADAAPEAESAVIPGANHVFNAVNPLPSDAPLETQTAELFERTVSFALRCSGATPAAG